jgi:hypothetical protein
MDDKQNRDGFHSLFRKTYPRPHKRHISFVRVGRPRKPPFGRFRVHLQITQYNHVIYASAFVTPSSAVGYSFVRAFEACLWQISRKNDAYLTNTRIQGGFFSGLQKRIFCRFWREKRLVRVPKCWAYPL